MALHKVSRKVAGKVFGKAPVPKLDKDGKIVRDSDGDVVMVNPEIIVEELTDDTSAEEVMAAFGNDTERIRKALIDAYNANALEAARDPFAAFKPVGMDDDKWKVVKLSAQNLSKAGLTPEAAIKAILSALK